MRKRGRRYEPLTENDRQIVEQFMNNDLTYDEMAAVAKMSVGQLRNRVMKYQKEMEDMQKNENEIFEMERV